ncbi:hypothetical protein BK126_24595 [Paenibacillus sp. FSL H7-0326]|uniref:DUF4321 domain-containing protein n=1 Tax=Paenibacillus sp. FSL H7-0326 TaxID=1921144 RepID=UPI00096E8515|nr:DUF4321 domain-containing protein [Paenibacillus sp. FSL H7-0326]OMC64937.1 hypothetical protein BK126_24595 [Paenibacillus sp. FSL H7-0326]
MKKNFGIFILFLLLGWLIGASISKGLEQFEALSFLTNATTISWSPKANFDIISYRLNIQLKISLLSLLGVVFAIWLYRKL